MSKEVVNSIMIKTDIGLQVQIDNRGVKNLIDEPEFNGGTNTGMTPVELEIGALGASLQAQAQRIAKVKEYSYDKLKIEIEGDIDLDGLHGNPDIPNGFQKIRINYIFKTKMNEQEIKKFVKEMELQSDIFKMIAHPVKVVNVLSEEE